ncbi:MAG: hypothetical protein U9Q03_03310 [Patescibacteria group bacterium]|nr:hypothetical protein [Patescibacteria group bacterium]
MKVVQRIYGVFLKRPWLGYVLVFLLTLAIYGATQAHPSMRDPDSFYHARIAAMTMESGPVRDFPWLPYTTLSENFADHHFLYHIALIPFIAIWGPLAGTKIAAALFGALAILAVYTLMRTLRVRFPCVFALMLATLDNFMFRMNLAKTSSLSIIILMLGIVAMMRRKPWLLAPLAFIYVWTYAGWPILSVIAAAFLVSALVVRLLERRFKDRLIRPGNDPVSVGIKALVATVIGSAAGLVINPFFPANLKFYLAQIGHITVLNYSEVIKVGVEWYPYPFMAIVRQNGSLFFIATIVFALLVSALVWKKEAGSALRPFGRCNATAIVFIALLTTAFLILTLKSRRHVEYFIPFMMLLNAVMFTAVMRRVEFRKLWDAVFGRFLILGKLVAVLLIVIIPILAIRDANAIHSLFRGGPAWTRLQDVTDWMDGRVPEGDIVFHSNWSDFPALFYHAPEFRYISGLDPTFFYLQSPKLYEDWMTLRYGEYGDRTAEIVRERFGSDYIMIRRVGDESFEEAIESDPTLQLVYEDDEVRVYTGL